MEVYMSETIYIDPEISQDDKTWSLLSYIFTPLVPFILLFIKDKRKRPFIKSHYVQALVWGIVIYAIAQIFPGHFLPWIVRVFGLVMDIIWGIKAHQGGQVDIPVITKMVKDLEWV